MKTTKRYTFNNNILELYVKKSPLIGRGFLLFLAFVMVALPLLGMILTLKADNAFHFGFLIGLGIFSLIGFYFLRLFLWNTYGKEVITFEDNTISYYVDYHYFKGNQQKINYKELVYEMQPIGFEEERLGRLVITDGEAVLIESAVNFGITALKELVLKLEGYRL